MKFSKSGKRWRKIEAKISITKELMTRKQRVAVAIRANKTEEEKGIERRESVGCEERAESEKKKNE